MIWGDTRTRLLLLAVLGVSLLTAGGAERPGSLSKAPNCVRDGGLELDDALVAARSDDFGPAYRLSRSLISEDPASLVGWYLRFLSENAHPLSIEEEAALRTLDDLPSTLREYLRLPRAERLVLTEQALDTHPEQPFTHALHASVLYDLGDFEGALAAAREVIRLDEWSAFGARIELKSLERAGRETSLTDAACRSLPRFPCDSLVVDSGLQFCALHRQEVDPVAILAPVIRAQRFRPRGRRALGLLLSALERRAVPLPSDDWAILLSALDPNDESWWPHAEWLIWSMQAQAAQLPADQSVRFLEGMFAASVRSASSERDGIVRGSPLVRARVLEAQGQYRTALRGLKRAMPYLLPIRRVEHLERMADLAARMGHRRQAQRFEATAYALSNPFRPVPERLRPGLDGSVEDVFQTLEPQVATTWDDTTRTIDWCRPTLLIFWSPTCTFSRLETQRIQNLSTFGTLTQTAGLEVLWVNRDRPGFAAEADQFVREFDLPADATLRIAGTETETLSGQLRVSGTPWVVLVAPPGAVVYETRGHGAGAWEQDIGRIIEGLPSACGER